MALLSWDPVQGALVLEDRIFHINYGTSLDHLKKARNRREPKLANH
jgi:hypothetical protein